MKKLLLLLLFVANLTLAQQVAVTIDDFPFRGPQFNSEDQKPLIDKLYDALEQFGIKATGFLNAGRINEHNMEGLRDYLNRGHDFGNHTYRHSNVDQVGIEAFRADIDSGMVMSQGLINTRYFRYPYLRRGKTLETRDSIYAHLKSTGYTIAPVSIDNDEWIYNRDYVKAYAQKDHKAMDSIGQAYLNHMKHVSTKYHRTAKELTGRDIRHILLIHANLINAIYLKDLLQWYTDQGWSFITLDEAMLDPIYSMEGDIVSPHGWSQIDKLHKIRKEQR